MSGYKKCTSSVSQGEDILIRIDFGVAIAKYYLSAWERPDSSGKWRFRYALEERGSTEDNRPELFRRKVDWVGDLLFFVHAAVAHPVPGEDVSVTIEIANGLDRIGESTVTGKVGDDGAVGVRNGLIVEAEG